MTSKKRFGHAFTKSTSTERRCRQFSCNPSPIPFTKCFRPYRSQNPRSAACLELDETMFACGQAYVAINRAKRWEDIAKFVLHTLAILLPLFILFDYFLPCTSRPCIYQLLPSLAFASTCPCPYPYSLVSPFILAQSLILCALQASPATLQLYEKWDMYYEMEYGTQLQK